MGWLKQALTGADNQTIAIGRLIGFSIALVLLIGLPVTAAATIIAGIVEVETWATFMTALQVYVPLVVAAIGGLVWGTNSTEPRPRDDRDGDPSHP
ncbi:hypothetical protein [Novosphingobium sp. FSW06-99]|uniref:hypothetical protein n=1 Tax=Novosphingobium sp. FSW06-99 TaxID=1739113 RepID=UPI00076C991A|nr:hypothetical protein [Novosphingobium sp. FSW06-99]KUR80743.1 hypothetical protein AQZ49_01565 [Novosphingobium sp. FSW06-99]